MWAVEYKGEFGEQIRSIESKGRASTYEVEFDFCGIRRYCHIDADCLAEAMGVFFMEHEDVPFRDVVEYGEVVSPSGHFGG